MLADAHWARRQRKRGSASPQELVARLQRSAELAGARAAARPKVTYPPDLPVSAHVAEIQTLLRERAVVVVCGETGSGKTTQIPKALLEMGLGIRGTIGHTQPRRLAARSVAARLADELAVPKGRQVGSKVRFADRTSPETLIKVMTDGILLAEMQRDRHLLHYDAIIIDEAHERSLNIDFLLGCLRRLLDVRPELKIVVTSATIDPERFAEHFADAQGPAPIIEVSGRTYPVEVRYRPTRDDAQGRDRARLVAEAVDELWRNDGTGDTLVFEPGEREIRETAEALQRLPGVEVLPLYARLAHHHQDRVFTRSNGRRVVVTTNVAETSLTVPGIRYVIDTGVARINRYSPRSKVQRLEIEPISRASAAQRAGRCGRVGPGICLRLYDEADLLTRPEFTDPEIARCNLAAVILQMRALRLGAVEAFPFVEAPDPRRVRDAYALLTQLGALDEQGELTPMGHRLANLPIDPRLGRMLLEAHERAVLADTLVVVAALATQDPRDRPFDKRDQADEAHEEFVDESSDFLTLLNIWRFLDGLWERHSTSKIRRACLHRYLSYTRAREWRDTHRQLRLLLSAMGYHADDHAHNPAELHRALLAGLADNVACKQDRGSEYDTPRGQTLVLWPGSALASNKPKWVFSAEVVQTSRLFARTLAAIEPEDIEHAAGSMLSRAYAEPRWDRRRGRATASMTVRLGNLELARDRRVHFGPVEPAASRELLIREGLLPCTLRRPPRPIERNADLLDRLHRLEIKQRATGTWALDERAFAFYDAKLPPDIWTTDRFARWWRSLSPDEQRALRMRAVDLVEPEVTDESAFPDHAEAFGTRLRLDYTHDASSERDGLTTEVPIHLLLAMRPEPGEWLVPGMLPEKVGALVKLLPKDLRRRIDTARFASAASRLDHGRGDLRDALSSLAARECNVEIPRVQWGLDGIPIHLRMRYRILDAGGDTLEEGRDLTDLQHKLRALCESTAARAETDGYPRHKLTRWDFDLPEHIDTGAQGQKVRLYPAIIDAGRSISLELRASPQEALAATRLGVRRLAALTLGREARLDPRRLPGFERAAALYSPLADANTLRDQLLLTTATRACDLDRDLPRTGLEFDAAIEAAWHHAETDLRTALTEALATLEERQRLAIALDTSHPPAWGRVINDARAQVAALVPATFLADTPTTYIPRLSLYLRGVARRVDRLRTAGPERDAARTTTFRDAARELETAMQRSLLTTDDLRELRWLLEELRLAVFAEGLAPGPGMTPKRFTQEVRRRSEGTPEARTPA